MKLGFVSDAHGNFAAFLKAMDVLKQNNADRIFFLGDAIGYFDSLEVVSYLKNNGIPTILGNHEDMVLKKQVPEDRESFYRLKQHFDSFIVPIIAEWPLTLELAIKQRNILLLHGSVNDPVWGYTHENTEVELNAKYDLLVCGATHRPFIKKIGTQILANIGSCGFPRDIGMQGSCGIYDVDEHKFEIMRFDISDSITILRNTHSNLEAKVTDVWERIN